MLNLISGLKEHMIMQEIEAKKREFEIKIRMSLFKQNDLQNRPLSLLHEKKADYSIQCVNDRRS